MLTFGEFIKESYLFEMPWIKVGDKTVDLELEVHSSLSKNQFISFLDSWLSGKTIQSKNPNVKMEVPKEKISEFASSLIKQSYFKNFVSYHYGDEFWGVVLDKIKEYL